MMQFGLIDSVFNSLCLRCEHYCGYLDYLVLKLHIFDEMVIVKRITETNI